MLHRLYIVIDQRVTGVQLIRIVDWFRTIDWYCCGVTNAWNEHVIHWSHWSMKNVNSPGSLWQVEVKDISDEANVCNSYLTENRWLQLIQLSQQLIMIITCSNFHLLSNLIHALLSLPNYCVVKWQRLETLYRFPLLVSSFASQTQWMVSFLGNSIW